VTEVGEGIPKGDCALHAAMMFVSSYEPSGSWADVMHEAAEQRRHQPEGPQPIGDMPPSTRPTPMTLPSSGHLGPGQYQFSEALVKRATVCPKWQKGGRFQTINKDLEAESPAQTAARAVADGCGQASMQEASASLGFGQRSQQEPQPLPWGRRGPPLRHPKIRLGRAHGKMETPVISAPEGIAGASTTAGSCGAPFGPAAGATSTGRALMTCSHSEPQLSKARSSMGRSLLGAGEVSSVTNFVGPRTWTSTSPRGKDALVIPPRRGGRLSPSEAALLAAASRNITGLEMNGCRQRYLL